MEPAKKKNKITNPDDHDDLKETNISIELSLERIALNVETYKYKMIRFEHYRKLTGGPNALSEEYIRRVFPELIEFIPRDGVTMEVKDNEKL